MSRIRTIKPEFWLNEYVAECSFPARLMLIGLACFSDYDNVHPDSHRRIKLEVFPYDSYTDEDIENWIQELIAASLLERFSASGITYLRLIEPLRFFGATRLERSEWGQLRIVVFERDGYACVYCGATDEKLECDHRIPLSQGGGNSLDNLVTACSPCNRSKGGRTPEEWRQ